VPPVRKDGDVAEQSGRSVVVTGASTGIGAATVGALVQRGFRVWAGVRSEEAAERLAGEHAGRVRVLRFDVTDEKALAAAGEQVRADGPLYGLVNNAGLALPGPLEFLPLAALREQLDVNLLGQLAVTQQVLPALRATPGRIVMIGSIGDRIATPMLGPYHISKFGLVGLTDTLRAELAPWKIPVILVEPGAIATPIWSRGASNAEGIQGQMPARARELYAAQIERARRNATRSARDGLPPDAAAAVIVRALTDPNPRPRYLVGRDAYVASLIARLPYRLRYRLTAARS
jgi:NAD(P)-dependent dehydrogenase (short-subunit alcohol dehydrogenase family)